VSSASRVEIPAGEFLRGSPDELGMPNERPQRRVFVSAFSIDRLPVSFADFARFIAAGGYRDRSLWSDAGWALCEAEKWERPRFFEEPEWKHVSGLEQPACGVSWFEAEAYARWVGGRLPTEAEWEKSARGVDDARVYPWGDEWEEGRCSFRGGPVRAAPPVGSFPSGASPYGVLDLAGGLWEWCSDWYDEGYWAHAPAADPRGPETGSLKAARGGSWNAVPLLNRCANRNAWRPGARFSNIGFRCVYETS
jgi:iron(II)-dependent oxidoreductase